MLGSRLGPSCLLIAALESGITVKILPVCVRGLQELVGMRRTESLAFVSYSVVVVEDNEPPAAPAGQAIEAITRHLLTVVG